MARRRAALRARSAGAGAGAQDRWIVSYADFMTLLFAFFTTLYAMSVTDAYKAQRLVESLRQSFGDSALESGAAAPGAFDDAFDEGMRIEGASHARQHVEENRHLELLGERARKLGDASAHPSGVRVRRNEEGLVISLADTLFFARGGVRLSDEARQTLAGIAALLGPISNHVRVEGHTDSTPSKNDALGSNWHLSVLRAVMVLEIFEAEGVPSHRLSASGFADQRPVASNATQPGREMNRRVDIVVLRARAAGSDA